MLHLLQKHTAFAGVAPSETDTVKKPERVNSKLNRMTKMFFTAPAHTFDRSGSDRPKGNGRGYFLAFFSAASTFEINFLGALSKSFLQDLQQSLISRPS